MAGENKARQLKNYIMTSEIIPEEYMIQVGGSSRLTVPSKKRKEDAKPILYLDRV